MTERMFVAMLDEMADEGRLLKSTTKENTKLRAALRTITQLLDPDNEVRDHMTATSAYEVAVEALEGNNAE
jgi:hypothetical protein